MNRISMHNRLLIGIISTLVMLFVFIFPSELTEVWESEGLQGFVIVLIISVAAIQIAAISKVFKALPWIETFPFLLSLALIWSSMFVVDGTFQITPGDYRFISPSFLVLSVPMFMLLISALLAGIMLLAPAQEAKNELHAQAALLDWKNRISAKYSRRTRTKGIAGVIAVFITLDFASQAAMIASTNSCVEERFQQGWRSAYLGDPWQLSLTWSTDYVQGYERQGGWWASPTEIYRGPKNWSAFVKEVTTDGVPVTIVENGVRSIGNLLPMKLEDAYYSRLGFDFDQYVGDLKYECLIDLSPPIFPIDSGWRSGNESIKDSISDIDGYVAPAESPAP
jgi:hypothetical protein